MDVPYNFLLNARCGSTTGYLLRGAAVVVLFRGSARGRETTNKAGLGRKSSDMDMEYSVLVPHLPINTVRMWSVTRLFSLCGRLANSGEIVNQKESDLLESNPNLRHKEYPLMQIGLERHIR